MATRRRIPATVDVLVTAAIAIAGIAPPASLAETFYDDFSRTDGPLQDPWTPFNGELAITSEHLVEDASEFGMMGYIAAREFGDGSLQVLFSFNGDEDGGRFNLYLGGGSAEESWSFNGVISRDGLAIETLAGEQVASLAAVAAIDSFQWCAVAIENTTAHDRWLDDFYLATDGRMSELLSGGLAMAGRGYMDGCGDHFLEVRDNQEFVETTFYTVDSPYLSMHAYTQTEGGGFTLYPADCYLVKLDNPMVADGWQSFMDGLVDALITAQEPVTTPAGTFDALRVEYRRPDTDELVFIVWYADDVGVVRWGASVEDTRGCKSSISTAGWSRPCWTTIDTPARWRPSGMAGTSAERTCRPVSTSRGSRSTGGWRPLG